MIVLGDISGIQNYVFDVAEEGGGQAQRLRARSFFVQLLAETAALRVLRALGWPLDSAHILLSGAGKFVLRGPGSPDMDQRFRGEQQTINEWLLRNTRGELRLTLAWDDSPESDEVAYGTAQRALQQSKQRPWGPTENGSWDPSRLILLPLDTPCSLCGHAPATEDETDRDNGHFRRVCRNCAANRRLGQRLPRAAWLVIHNTPESADFEVLGLGVNVLDEQHVDCGPETVAVANLREPDARPSWCPPQQFLKRRLMAQVPSDAHGSPVWFTDLVNHAQGDRLLAVLKADADSLGVQFQRLLSSDGLDGMVSFSEQLDAFFAGKLRLEMANHRAARWQWIYTIFAGGDDLVMVGPWDIMLDFAAEMCQWFAQEFRTHGLTLSAGLALMKPKRPIKVAVAEAERLLELAKTGTKDQLAAFGQVWNWRQHDKIMKTARQLVEWVNSGDMERGCLHTLLELAEARHGPMVDALATARLAYHVSRNYRRKTRAREWAERLVERFDNRENIDVRYLPATIRYALTATRTRGEEQ
jgi:CRISPR-associated protein Csm1